MITWLAVKLEQHASVIRIESHRTIAIRIVKVLAYNTLQNELTAPGQHGKARTQNLGIVHRGQVGERHHRFPPAPSAGEGLRQGRRPYIKGLHLHVTKACKRHLVDCAPARQGGPPHAQNPCASRLR